MAEAHVHDMCVLCQNSSTSVNCSDISKVQLQNYDTIYKCVRDNNHYALVGMTEQYILNRINLIFAALIDKQSNARSCNYSMYISDINQDMTTIINAGVCL